jgi:hypothetical protein
MNIKREGIKAQIADILGVSYIQGWIMPLKICVIYNLIKETYLQSENIGHGEYRYEGFLSWVNTLTEQEFFTLIILCKLKE